jgi:hypothetical protein
MTDGKVLRNGFLNSPPKILLTALSALRSDVEMYRDQSPRHVHELARKYPTMEKTYACPESLKDFVFKAEDVHEGGDNCAPYLFQFTPERENTGIDVPKIQFGLIASANQVMKDANRRDEVSDVMGEPIALKWKLLAS